MESKKHISINSSHTAWYSISNQKPGKKNAIFTYDRVLKCMILETHHIFMNRDIRFPSCMWSQLAPLIYLLFDTIFILQQGQVKILECVQNTVIICTFKTRCVKSNLPHAQTVTPISLNNMYKYICIISMEKWCQFTKYFKYKAF